MSMIFDTHAHYDDEAFNEGREDLLSGLSDNGVGTVVNAGASLRSLPRVLSLAGRYDFIYGMAGLHPCETYASGDNTGKPVMYLTDLDGRNIAQKQECRILRDVLDRYDANEIITPGWTALEREADVIEAMLASDRIKAVGEIGLDYHYDDTRKDIQKDWLARQIAVARKHSLPIVIHSRDAAADTLDMIISEKARDCGGIIHCFSYSKEMAAKYIDMGFMIGIGGVVTYKNAVKIKEVVSFMPVDSMVLETDCPYLAPAPFRGKRNDSSMIKYVVQAVSQIKGIPEDEVIGVTEKNARRVFQLE